MKIILFGKNGQVGNELQKTLLKEYDLLMPDRSEVDFLDHKSIEKIITHYRPDLIINAAAYTNVDLAEEQENKAFSINSEALKVISNLAFKNNSYLIHYSTDYVFDGNKKGAYIETDFPNPINIYGRSKLDGENYIKKSGCSFCIFRTSWVISRTGLNFVNNIVKLANEREELRVIVDQLGVPTSASFIAKITKEFISNLYNRNQGVYHLVPNGLTNWYELTIYILKYLSKKRYKLKLLPNLVVPIKSIQYKTTAKRPLNSELCNLKISTELGIELPLWNHTLDPILESIINE